MGVAISQLTPRALKHKRRRLTLWHFWMYKSRNPAASIAIREPLKSERKILRTLPPTLCCLLLLAATAKAGVRGHSALIHDRGTECV
jgi:hypothetical protein